MTKNVNKCICEFWFYHPFLTWNQTGFLTFHMTLTWSTSHEEGLSFRSSGSSTLTMTHNVNAVQLEHINDSLGERVLLRVAVHHDVQDPAADHLK